MFFIFHILLQAQAFSRKSQSFLQSDSSTSLGELAGGLESFSASFADFTNRLDESLSDIEAQLEVLNTVNEDVAITLIDSDIAQLTNELEEIAYAISEIDEILYESDECTILGSCGDCVENSRCVWCVETLQCSKGDDDGPLQGTCNDYSYNKCNSKACDRFLTCTICLSSDTCGWCQNGMYCLSGTADDSGDCEDTFYYHIEAGGRDVCPDIANSEVAESESSEANDGDEAFEELEDDKEELEEKASEIELLIEELKLDEEEIKETAELSNSLELTSVVLESALQGLEEEVEQLYIEEIEEEQEFQQSLADETVTEIVEESSAVIEANTVEVEGVVTSSTTELSNEITDVNSELSAQLSEIIATAEVVDDTLIAQAALLAGESTEDDEEEESEGDTDESTEENGSTY